VESREGRGGLGEGDEQQYQQKSGSVAQVSIASRPYKLHLFSSGGKAIPQKRTHARTQELEMQFLQEIRLLCTFECK